jgi:hypothetical protein
VTQSLAARATRTTHILTGLRSDPSSRTDWRSISSAAAIASSSSAFRAAIGDGIYVRSVRGRGSSWFRGAQTRHEVRIRAGSIDKDVTLVETDDQAEVIDDAYDAKYSGRYPSIVPSIVAAPARDATLKLVPQ